LVAIRLWRRLDEFENYIDECAAWFYIQPTPAQRRAIAAYLLYGNLLLNAEEEAEAGCEEARALVGILRRTHTM
jgi:hypothetical protein